MNNTFSLLEQEVGEWQVWVENDPISDLPHIYVFGEAYGASLNHKPKLVKAHKEATGQLHLELKNAIAREEGFYTEVMYSERLVNDFDEVIVTIGNTIILKEGFSELV